MSKVYIEEINTSLSAFQIYELFHMEKYSFILDSGMDQERLGRYSFIGYDPFITIETKENKTLVKENVGISEILTGNPFEVLKDLLCRYKIQNNSDFPFVGGAVGFMAYDLHHHIEKLHRNVVDDMKLPDMVFGLYDTIIVVDHLQEKTYIVALDLNEINREKTGNRITEVRKRLYSNANVYKRFLDIKYLDNEIDIVSNFTKEEYCAAIEKAREYIKKGDIYEMNMTQRFSTLIDKHPLNIYSNLRTINPAPFAAYMNYGKLKILCSSPERFLKIKNAQVEARPMKGTIPRGGTVEEDKTNKQKLKNSVKDRAENLMIVDLMRNDLGRVCKFGSIKVPELFCIEKYATVFQMVSTVTGELKEDCHAVDCITATFPGGSITGAPKIRSMEIIDELEPTCRHIYTGSIGYIGFDGDMDLNIVIRTILINDKKAYYQTGGAIVWDSVPEDEYEETMVKGAALRCALMLKTHGSLGGDGK
jgi:para-aminobenzoate synthetase component 1